MCRSSSGNALGRVISLVSRGMLFVYFFGPPIGFLVTFFFIAMETGGAVLQISTVCADTSTACVYNSTVCAYNSAVCVYTTTVCAYTSTLYAYISNVPTPLLYVPTSLLYVNT